MSTYRFSLKYSKDGKTWYGTTTSVSASSERTAISMLKSKYPYVKEIKLLYVK